jgi:hypothetical protein
MFLDATLSPLCSPGNESPDRAGRTVRAYARRLRRADGFRLKPNGALGVISALIGMDDDPLGLWLSGWGSIFLDKKKPQHSSRGQRLRD